MHRIAVLIIMIVLYMCVFSLPKYIFTGVVCFITWKISHNSEISNYTSK